MSPELAEYIERGKALDADEREIAALVLQHVDAGEQAEIDAAWEYELCCRLEEIEAGEVELISGTESDARVRALLAEFRN